MEETLDGTELKNLKAPGPQPFGLTWDGKNLWVSDRNERKIYQVDPESGQAVFSIAFDGELTGTAWDGTHVWQADQSSRTISRIDPESGDIVLALKVELANGDVTGLSYETDKSSGLWYALSRLGQARKVRPEDGVFMKAYPTKPDVCGLVAVDKHLYYTEPGAGLVHKVHIVAGSILISYKVGGKPTGLCHDGEAFWIADQESATIRRLTF